MYLYTFDIVNVISNYQIYVKLFSCHHRRSYLTAYYISTCKLGCVQLYTASGYERIFQVLPQPRGITQYVKNWQQQSTGRSKIGCLGKGIDQHSLSTEILFSNTMYRLMIYHPKKEELKRKKCLLHASIISERISLYNRKHLLF